MLTTRVRKVMRAADDRLTSGHFLRNQLNKIFPDHWSFMLGEIALYCFIILVVTGTFLTFFFVDSTHDVVYKGSYVPLRGVKASEAYSSVLNIIFDVRAGLLIRQIHHWAALLFLAAIVIHMTRVFLTGAFRKPRDLNWVIGVTLLATSMVEGFAGYSLPDDLLSGTGLRIAYSIVESIPVVGSYLAVFLWGGQYPGHGQFFARLYIGHVFLLPGLIIALLAAHLGIVWHQKHTQFAQTGRTERNVVGSMLWPRYSIKSQGLFFMVFGFLAMLAAYAQINPVWLYGPYDPAKVSAGSQPDWYMWWLEGTLRLMPDLETHFLGHSIDWGVFVPAVVFPLCFFGALYIYPFLERRLTRDHASHELLQLPRNHPVRSAIGASMLTLFVIVNIAGNNDIVAYTFRLNMMEETWALRVLFFLAPMVAFLATFALCRRRARLAALERFAPPETATVGLVETEAGYVVAQDPGTPTAPAPEVGSAAAADAGEHPAEATQL